MIAFYKDEACTQKIRLATRALTVPAATLAAADVSHVLVRPADRVTNGTAWQVGTGSNADLFLPLQLDTADAYIGTIAITSSVLNRTSGPAYALEIYVVPKVTMPFNYFGDQDDELTTLCKIWVRAEEGVEYRSCFVYATDLAGGGEPAMRLDTAVTGLAVVDNVTIDTILGASLAYGDLAAEDLADFMGMLAIVDGTYMGTIVAYDNATHKLLLDNTSASYTGVDGVSWVALVTNNTFTYSSDGMNFGAVTTIGRINSTPIPLWISKVTTLGADPETYVNLAVYVAGSEYTEVS